LGVNFVLTEFSEVRRPARRWFGAEPPSLSLFTRRRGKWHPEKFSMTNGNIGAVGLFWGSLWRACLYGVFLTACLGALYGAACGTLTFLLIGTAFGLFFEHLNSRRYRWPAGIVCTAGNLLALVVDWALHDLPDPTGFATDRASDLALDLFLPVSDQNAALPANTIIRFVWVFVPMLMILLALWLTGRLVSGWYADKVSGT
jgi:hypothetical protein